MTMGLKELLERRAALNQEAARIMESIKSALDSVG